jgi:hypothetical protein
MPLESRSIMNTMFRVHQKVGRSIKRAWQFGTCSLARAVVPCLSAAPIGGYIPTDRPQGSKQKETVIHA